MADKKVVKKTVVEKKLAVIDNKARNEVFLKVYCALCSNPQSSNDTEILVGQAQALTLGALEGMAKEQF